MAADSQPSRDLFTGVTILACKGTFKSFSCFSTFLFPISVITALRCFQMVRAFGHYQLRKFIFMTLNWKASYCTSATSNIPSISPLVTFKFISFPLQLTLWAYISVLVAACKYKAATRTAENIRLLLQLLVAVFNGTIFCAVQTTWKSTLSWRQFTAL